MQARNGGQQQMVVGQQGRAMAPAGNGGPKDELERVFAQAMPKLAAVVPKHVDVNKLVRLGIAAIMKDPNLLKCTPATLLLSLLQIASLGLEPNTPLQQAYIWGTRNKKKVKDGNATVEKWVEEAQPIVGYRGYILLATQAGDLRDVDADVVYEKDTRKIRRGTNPGIEHEPYEGDDPGPMVGVYCTWTLPNGEKKFRYWPKHRIDTYVQKFGYSIGQGGSRYLKNTYKNHLEAMVLKGVIRDSTRFWPLSSERSDKVRKAFEIDDREAQNIGPSFAAERALIAKNAPELLTDLRNMGDNPDAEVEDIEADGEAAPNEPSGEAPPAEEQAPPTPPTPPAPAEDRKSEPAKRQRRGAQQSFGDDAENFERD